MVSVSVILSPYLIIWSSFLTITHGTDGRTSHVNIWKANKLRLRCESTHQRSDSSAVNLTKIARDATERDIASGAV